VGAFSWSQGLEGACAEGLVRDGSSLRLWLLDILHFGLARFDLPVLLRCHRAAQEEDKSAFLRWDALLLAGRESAELLLEEEQMGLALCRILRAHGLWPAWLSECSCGYAAAFALAALLLGCPSGVQIACAYAMGWLQNQAVAACKCLPLGQNEAQGVVLGLMPLVARSAEAAARVPDEDVGSSLPGLGVTASRHERQYSRMFRS
jgi:urease accessory protein